MNMISLVDVPARYLALASLAYLLLLTNYIVNCLDNLKQDVAQLRRDREVEVNILIAKLDDLLERQQDETTDDDDGLDGKSEYVSTAPPRLWFKHRNENIK